MTIATPSQGELEKQFRNEVMSDPQFPSFGQLFELHRLLEEGVSKAARDGEEICPAEIVEKLLSGGPRSGVSAAEIHEALMRAAAQAGVKVRLN